MMKPSYSINRQDLKCFSHTDLMTLFYLGFYAQLWGVNSLVLKAMWPKFANGQKMSLVADKRRADTCVRLQHKMKEYLKNLIHTVTAFKNSNSLSLNSRLLCCI